MTADRYLRAGAEESKIYPGTLPMLETALQEAASASKRVPGRHYVISVRGRERQVLQVYENGMCTWYLRRTGRDEG